MRFIIPYLLFERKTEKDKKNSDNQEISDVKNGLLSKFKKTWGVEIDPNFDTTDIKLIEKAFSLFDKKVLKNKIHKIHCKNLGGVHGKWHETEKKKEMTLNPSIFKFSRRFENGESDVPYKLFIVIHEIGHCLDHIDRISFSKEWQSISGWKKCDINERVPKGYKRYIEKRSGRKLAGHKKSNWIHKEDADFCRKYTSRNPREDFADCFAHGVLGLWHKFKGEGGQKKMEIIKKILKKVD